MEAVWIAAAFVLGLALRHIGLPPLIGFLLAGFVLNAGGVGGEGELEHIAHLGVLLLLFTIGLKLRLSTVFQRHVWGTALIHLLVTVAVLTPVILLVTDLTRPLSLLVAIALGFSSTVLAAKLLTEKRELKSFHGRVAIGVLIIQDLLAVVALSLLSGQAPSPLAVGLFGLPLLRPALYWGLDFSGRGELLILFGMLLALGAGTVFDALGLSSELGAVVMGAMIADHGKSGELYGALWSLKEFFLVAFFLQIGLSGLPDLQSLGVAVALAAVIPLKAALFFFILVRFGLRARTAFLAGLSLASYSEFGLIVASMAAKKGWLDPGALVVLAVTVAVSFVVASPAVRRAHELFESHAARLERHELADRHPDEEPMSVGDASILVVGMGKVATAAYDALRQRGERVAGLDSDQAKVERLVREGRHVLYGDAEDPSLWQYLDIGPLRAVLLGMPDTESQSLASAHLRARGYRGVIGAISNFAEDAACVAANGADLCYSYTQQAGEGFAERLLHELSARRAVEAGAD